jgi:transcriptional regulator with XRE-family HTH domain
MDDLNAIGARIRRARLDKGLTQVELAGAIGISRSHLTNAEGGNNGLGLDKLLLLARELGTTVAWLIGEAGPSDPQEMMLLAVFRSMSKERRRALIEVLAPPGYSEEPLANAAQRTRTAAPYGGGRKQRKSG